jgi:hypothetical protein
MARTTQKTPPPLSECTIIGPLHSTGHGADHIKTLLLIYFFIACAHFRRCLEIGLHITLYTWQWLIKLIIKNYNIDKDNMAEHSREQVRIISVTACEKQAKVKNAYKSR